MKNLFDLNVGETATVCEINADSSMRRRLLDIGLTKGTKTKCVGRSPSGDPKAFFIRGAIIAIRSEDCKNIKIQDTEVI